MKKSSLIPAVLLGAASLILTTSAFAVVGGPGPTQEKRSEVVTPDGKTQADKMTMKTVRPMGHHHGMKRHKGLKKATTAE